MKDQSILERVTLNPKVMAGKPLIRGTRLTVEYILNLLGHGATVEGILEEYDGLTPEDIQACLLFATRFLEDTTFMPLQLETVEMRCLVDECTGPKVADWLRDQGHEVLSVYHEARGLDDEAILDKAFSENWILITNDKDFGEKGYR